ncbi:hypothetical protein PIROE2DRAFT_3111, partial [Piromyces sp. E2]
MRPDPYKQKKSRRYQLTHKNKLNNKNDNNKEQNVKEKTTDNNDINNNSNKIGKPKPTYNRRANRTFIDE